MITSKLKLSSLLSLFLLLILAGCAKAQQPLEPAAGADEKIKQVFSKIYEGDFHQAAKLINPDDSISQQNSELSQLKEIVSEYQGIEDRRASAKVAAYTEKMAELEKIRIEAEVNEPNSLSEVFVVILKIHEFADEQQKKALLEDDFVKQMVQKAKDDAADLEAKGQWLDALIEGYGWLGALYEDNKNYKEAKERLTEKLLIKAAMQDSPCESYDDRYEGIEPEMFIRAIEVLSLRYVGSIDYTEMAEKAVQRCQLLIEVLLLADANGSTLKIEEIPPFELVLPEDETHLMNRFESIAFEFNRENIPAFLQSLNVLKNDIKNTPTGLGNDKFIDIFNKVLALNETTTGLPKEILIAQFADASLSSLDPHTTLIWPWQTKDFEKSMTNEFTGVGIEISKADGLLRAVSLLPGTPAYYSGLDAGDVIEAVDGESTEQMTIQCAVSKITGPAGTKVKLTVRHENQEETEDIIVTRARIIVPTIRGWQRTEDGNWLYMVDAEQKIGYVRITNFSGSTALDFEMTLRKMEKEGLNGLIVDLRYNAGGYLQSAAEITDMFVEEGLIVESKPRFGYRSREVAHKRGTHPKYPLVVLLNAGSASASEIVAGALADPAHSRAILVGNRSYGKGTVQTITDYPGNGAQMKYTMAHYQLPGGDKVKSRYEMEKLNRKDWGIAPETEVKLRSDEIKQMIDIQKENDVLFKADHDNNHSDPKRHTIEETVQADAQLATAILVVKTKLIEKKYNK